MFAKHLIALSLAAVCFCADKVEATTLGHSAVNRSMADYYNNFVIVTDIAIPQAGDIVGWSTYIQRLDAPANGNPVDSRIAMLLGTLSNGVFTVDSVDSRAVTLGLNQFQSNISVQAGQQMAIFMADAKVGVDLVGGANHFYATGDQAVLAPAAGQQIAVTSTGTPVGDWHKINREYSLSLDFFADPTPLKQATTQTQPHPAPLPAGLVLLLTGLGFLAIRRRAA